MHISSPFSLRPRHSASEVAPAPDLSAAVRSADEDQRFSHDTFTTARDASPLSLSIPASTSADPDGKRRSRFMEDVLNAVQPIHGGADSDDTPFDDVPHDSSSSAAAAAATARPQQQQQQQQQRDSASPSSSPTAPGPAIGRPASIPARTSSSHAINGDKIASPRSAASRKHKAAAAASAASPAEPKSRVVEGEDARQPPRRSSRDRLSDSSLSKGFSLMSAFPLPPNHRAGGSSSENPVEGRASADASGGASGKLGGGGGGADTGRDLISGEDNLWTAEKENILKGPFDYLESHPGKDIRGQLISSFNAWLQVPPASLGIITKVVGMLHNASLLIDDVEDSSLLRRGAPVAHSIFGTAQTINSANYVYFCALQELLRLSNPEAVKIYAEELLNLHRGQGMDLFWRDTLTCPSEDDYLEMVGNKTGGLFRLAIKLMCAESPSHNANSPRASSSSSTAKPERRSDYVPLVNTVGLLFQILDDYRNLSDTAYTANKGLCEDLTEGKFSFPIIHSIRSDPANLVLINILKQKTKDDEVKRYALAYMERMGSFAYTRRVLRGLTKKALALVEDVDAGRGRGHGVTAILERLKVERHSKTTSMALT